MKAGRDPVEDLRRWLEDHQGCLEQQKDELQGLLSCAWHQFAGANQEGMRVDKLSRLEAPKWDPPSLWEIEGGGFFPRKGVGGRRNLRPVGSRRGGPP